MPAQVVGHAMLLPAALALHGWIVGSVLGLGQYPYQHGAFSASATMRAARSAPSFSTATHPDRRS